MRNVLLLITATLLLTACEKKYCWNCELRTTTLLISNKNDTVLTTQAQTEEVCHKSEREINIVQNERTYQKETEDQGIKTRKLYMYSCNKQ
ncbi:hypothetical protein [Polluticoccus soli]|uniref:hypothetical protein n=1 Tax=Polluticoccus soli TaxID=3034150 RepID=UPI0023E233A9|nr:hypothetical protein [Flavipsychrobacter sp. JY13-12]